MTIAYKLPANGCQMLPAAERPAETSKICSVNPWDDEDLAPILRARLYLDSRYRFRRNSITGRIEYAPLSSCVDSTTEGLGSSAENLSSMADAGVCFSVEEGGKGVSFIPLDKAHKHTLQMELAEAELPTIGITTLDTAIDNSRAELFDPVEAYLKGLPAWDGTDRISDLFSRFTDDAFEIGVLHRAFLATVGQMSGRLTYGNELCPIFISRTQGWGKSKSLRRLLPPELQAFFTDTFNLKREEECLRRMNGFVLINLDEIDRYSPASLALLKKLIQMKDLNIRRLYNNWMETLTRRASFWGTSNCRYVLTDPSGSRRFFPVEMKGVVDLDAPIDYAQLYAQAIHELEEERTAYEYEHENENQDENCVQKRLKPWFTAEENILIEAHNLRYNAPMALKALLDKHFEQVDLVDKSLSEAQAKRLGLLTAQDVYDELMVLNPELMGTFCEGKFGFQLKQNGYVQLRTSESRRYNLRRCPATQPTDADESLIECYAE